MAPSTSHSDSNSALTAPISDRTTRVSKRSHRARQSSTTKHQDLNGTHKPTEHRTPNKSIKPNTAKLAAFQYLASLHIRAGEAALSILQQKVEYAWTCEKHRLQAVADHNDREAKWQKYQINKVSTFVRYPDDAIAMPAAWPMLEEILKDEELPWDGIEMWTEVIRLPLPANRNDMARAVASVPRMRMGMEMEVLGEE